MTTFAPAPKPEPRSLAKAKREIPKLSQRQRAKREKNGERFISSTIAKSSLLDPHFRTRKSIKKKGRKPSEFARIYGSKSRVAWVKGLACVAHGPTCHGGIEGHHVITGGTARKADAKFIAPLCKGHHGDLHYHGRRTFEKAFGLDLIAEAAHTQTLWLLHCGRLGISPESGKPV